MKPAKKHKKGYISEEDVSNLFYRYSAQKVLALLQEVSQSANAKMDWKSLVKKTATGISNAREYQMLWRHIAYCDELVEKVDDGAEPMDDDSDLEYELEAYPAVSAEACAEAVACIKKQPVAQGSLQKQSVPPGATGEGSDVNGSTSTALPPRRKRKRWSEEEDLELIAAVKKCGDGNWANMLKGHFKGDRTAPQLYQRWAIIRKRQTTAHTTGPQLSDAQVAAWRAVDMPLKDNLLIVSDWAVGTSNPTGVNTSDEDNAVVNQSASQPQQSQSNPASGNLKSKVGATTSVPNLQDPPKNAPMKPIFNPDSSIVPKAAAAAGARIAAAGARIASPSDPASLFKAAHANNAVHIMPKGGSTLIKSSVSSNSNPKPSAYLGPNRSMPSGSQPARANFVRATAPSPTSSITISHATGSQPVRNNFMRPSVLPAPTSQALTSSISPNNSSAPLSQASLAATATGSPLKTHATACHPANELEMKKEEKTSEEMKPPTACPSAQSVPTQNGEAPQNPTLILSSAELVASNQGAAADNSQFSVHVGNEKGEIGNSKGEAVDNTTEFNSVADFKNQNAS